MGRRSMKVSVALALIASTNALPQGNGLGFSGTAPKDISVAPKGNYETKTIQYRGRTWTFPDQKPRIGGFDWDTVDGCMDASYIYYCPQPKMAVLSFDDGPSRPNGTDTARLLDIAAQEKVKLSLCMMGSNMAGNEELIRRAAREGHELCIHTERHPHLTEMSIYGIIDEILNSVERFQKILGVTPSLFRPPFGEVDLRVQSVVSQLGLAMYRWNLDSWDWKQNPEESLGRYSNAVNNLNDWRYSIPASDSYIALAHDIHPTTVGMTSKAIKVFRDGKFQITTANECLGRSRWVEGEGAFQTAMANWKPIKLDPPVQLDEGAPGTMSGKIAPNNDPTGQVTTVTQPTVQPVQPVDPKPLQNSTQPVDQIVKPPTNPIVKPIQAQPQSTGCRTQALSSMFALAGVLALL